MVDAIVLVAIEDESVVSSPRVGVDRRSSFHQTLHNGHQLALPCILDNLRVDPPPPLENPEDGDLVCASAFAMVVASPEVALVEFHFTLDGAVDRFLVLENLLPEDPVIPVHGDSAHTSKPRCLGGCEILTKASENF